MFYGRKKPYTEVGIGRVLCLRCGQPSVYQWQICANDCRYVGVCADCDVALNALVMEFFGLDNVDALLEHYMKERDYDGSHPAFTVRVAAIAVRSDDDHVHPGAVGHHFDPALPEHQARGPRNRS